MNFVTASPTLYQQDACSHRHYMAINKLETKHVVHSLGVSGSHDAVLPPSASLDSTPASCRSPSQFTLSHRPPRPLTLFLTLMSLSLSFLPPFFQPLLHTSSSLPVKPDELSRVRFCSRVGPSGCVHVIIHDSPLWNSMFVSSAQPVE